MFRFYNHLLIFGINYFYILISLIVLFFAIKSNIDLSNQRYELHMDERLTFDGVKNILNSKDLSAFSYNLIDGGDHRYGRVLWNFGALFSFLPELVYGVKGQIVFTRFMLIFFVFSTYFIVLFGVLESKISRLIFSLVYFFIPFTSYYLTMPKPEPIQVFFIALFVFVVKKTNRFFGLHWLPLGIAFGCKINLIPIGLIMMFLLFYRFRKDFIEEKKIIYISINSFLLGIMFAEPYLASVITSIIVILSLFYFILINTKKVKSIIYYSGLFLVFLFILFMFNFPLIKNWLNFTLYNTSHGTDSNNINFFSWIKYIISIYFDNSIVFIAIFLFLIVTSVVFYIKKSSSLFSQKIKLSYLILFFGFILILTIVLFVKRLWGIYLYPGTVLLLIGYCVFQENFPLTSKFKSNFIKKSILSMNIFIVCLSLFHWSNISINELINSSKRTESNEYKVSKLSYTFCKNYLDSIANVKKEKLKIISYPGFFPLQSNNDYQVEEYFGPFLNWKSKADFIIFYRKFRFTNKDVDFNNKLKEKQLFKKYVLEKCSGKNIHYEVVKSFMNGVVLLRLV